MKTKKSIIQITIFFAIFLVGSLMFVNFALADNCPLNTEAEETQATLVGEITDTGGDPYVEVWFQYGKTPSYGYETAHFYKYGTGLFCTTVYNLEPCTTYYYRAVAKNSAGTSYGENKTFTTKCSPVVVDLKANNSDGPITIPYNTSVILTWTSQNADSCVASGAWSGSKPTSGSESTGNLTYSRTYTLTCTGSGGSVSDSVVVNVSSNHPPVAEAGPDKQVYENETVILDGSGYDQDGDPITYSWSCNGGSLSNYNIPQPIFYAPSVSQNTYYTCTLTVTDSHGASHSDSMRVLVIDRSPAFSVSLSAYPSSGCSPLSNVDLTATVYGTTAGNITYFFDCTNDGIWDKIETRDYTPYTAYDVCNYYSPGNYTAKTRVEIGGLSAENTTQINIYNCYGSPTVDLKANNSDGPITIPYNTSVILTWTSQNADSCVASGAWSGSKPTSGSESTGNLTYSRTYTLTCTGSGGSVSDSVVVNVATQPVSGNLIINKLVRNLSDGTNWGDSVSADPSEVVSFLIEVTAVNSPLENVIIKDTLPDKIVYRQNTLKIDGVASSGNIFSGLNIGNLAVNQKKTITFDADIVGSDKFAFGETQLINTVIAYTTNISNSDTAKIIVTKKAVAGAATSISTGLTNNFFLDSFFLPLVVTLLIIFLFKSHIINFEEWLDQQKKRYQEYRAKKLLQLKIAQIKALEFLRK